jgi:outer membrane protein
MLDNTSEINETITEAKMIRSQLNLKQRRREDTRKPELIDFKQRSSKLFNHKPQANGQEWAQKKGAELQKKNNN